MSPQRVVERPHVRIDLLGEIARQEAQPLAGLDRRTRQDDARDLAAIQRRDRHRHREIGLARPGRPDRDRDVVFLDQVDITTLRQVLRADRLERSAQDVLVDVLELDLGLVAEHPDHVSNVGRANALPRLQELVELLEDTPRQRGLGLGPLDPDLVAAGVDLHAERSLEQPQRLLAIAVQGNRHRIVVEGEALVGCVLPL